MGLAVLYISVLSDVLVLLCDNILSFLDDSRVEVVLRNGLVNGWQDDTLCVRTLKNSADEGLEELLLVDVDAGPCSKA